MKKLLQTLHFHMQLARRYAAGVVNRHSKQGAKMQAARVQSARNKSNRGNASVAVLRSSTRKG
jgi:hypothetical protein